MSRPVGVDGLWEQAAEIFYAGRLCKGHSERVRVELLLKLPPRQLPWENIENILERLPLSASYEGPGQKQKNKNKTVFVFHPVLWCWLLRIPLWSCLHPVLISSFNTWHFLLWWIMKSHWIDFLWSMVNILFVTTRSGPGRTSCALSLWLLQSAAWWAQLPGWHHGSWCGPSRCSDTRSDEPEDGTGNAH